jgi:chemotaxis protein MotB
MTDMTISFLLIIMILLAFFATQLNNDDTVPLTAYERVHQERDELQVENRDLRVSVEVLKAELSRVQSDLEAVTAERDQLVEEIARLREKFEKLKVANPLEAYLLEAKEQRDSILEQLQARLLLKFPKLKEDISIERDALRFRGDGLFSPGLWDLPENSDQLKFIKEMGKILDDILVCFTLGVRAERRLDCESGNALIEAIQIEGHTDSDPGRIDNITLSTNRANETFFAIRKAVPGILAHENLRLVNMVRVLCHFHTTFRTKT